MYDRVSDGALVGVVEYVVEIFLQRREDAFLLLDVKRLHYAMETFARTRFILFTPSCY